MSYNKDTNWANEEEYLNNLIKTGSDGVKIWAQNQLGVLNQAKEQYGVNATPTTSPTAEPKPKPKLETDPTSEANNNNTMDVISGTVNETPITKPYNPDTDYQALINEAILNGDYQTAAIYEQLRNQKILGEGLDYETTDLYSSYLGGEKDQSAPSASDILGWVSDYNENNKKPTYNNNYYGQPINNLLSEILNREDFSYDVENDPLYAQFKTMYNREGDRAMRDTLAEAAASAGGMNSYAITAAQQANNYYASQLNDKIPELYQLAYEMYLQDKESKVQDLGILSDLDDKQYNRYRDTMSDYRADKEFAYGAYLDAVSQGNWEKTFDYNQSVDDRDYNFKDYWTNKEWTASEQDKAKDELLELISLGGTPTPEQIEKAGVDQNYVDLVKAAVQAGGGVDDDDNGYKGGKEPEGDDTPDDKAIIEGDTPETTGVTEEIRNTAASFTDNDALNDYLTKQYQSGKITEEEMGNLYIEFETPSLSDRNWSAGKGGGVNWLGGIDNNATVKDQYGNEYRLDKLVDALVAEGMDKKEAKDYVKNLQARLGL